MVHEHHSPWSQDLHQNPTSGVENEPIMQKRQVESFFGELEIGKGGRRAICISLVEKTESVHFDDGDIVGDLAASTVAGDTDRRLHTSPNDAFA